MKINKFTGKCSGKSTYNGNPVGKDFESDTVIFHRDIFQATTGGAAFIQIAYGESLEPGSHPLTFTAIGPASLLYNSGTDLRKLEGSGEVTIGDDYATQKGTFAATYQDEIGRTIQFAGDFDGQYELK